MSKGVGLQGGIDNRIVQEPIVTWLKNKPQYRYIRGSIVGGKVQIVAWEGSRVAGTGKGASIAEACAACCNDMQARMLEPDLAPVDAFGTTRRGA